MYFTYILKSKIKDWYYIGHSIDIEKRLREHNSGKSKSTSPYKPFEIVYSEKFKTKGEAFKREQQIKKYKHGQSFIKLVS